jgi:hypothetical protein
MLQSRGVGKKALQFLPCPFLKKKSSPVICTSHSFSVVRALKVPSSWGMGRKVQLVRWRDRTEFLTPSDKSEHGKLYPSYRQSISSSIPGVTATWSQPSMKGKQLLSRHKLRDNVLKPMPEWFLRMLSALHLNFSLSISKRSVSGLKSSLG